jgi:acetyl coenzyme A synthetase (ADP forming)-like protein
VTPAEAAPVHDPQAGLRAILAPRSIAVIGASRRASAMGHQIVRNLVRFGFTGPVYPVNPGASSVCSVPAVPTVRAIGEPVDLGVVVVPRDRALEVVAECGECGVKGLVVITAGFRETDDTGRERELELMRIVRKWGMRMVGPNCMGVVNADPAVSMNATFADVMPPFGHAAFVSQSGALGLNILDHAREYGIGVAQFVSVGNKPDVSGNDLLEIWEHDPAVRVILMYVENFGNPRRFLEIASRITPKKPIIAVKSGRSVSGARAASSHTGALAASDAAVDALLTQAGVLRAGSIEELFELAAGFETHARPRGRNIAVVTNAGGPGILAADALEAHELQLVELQPATVAALRPLFPAEASVRNPLDMIASATPDGYRRAMTALLADSGVHAVMPIFVPPFGVRQEDVAEAIAGAAATAPEKPVVAVLMGREGLPEGRAGLRAVGIPAFVFPESAARVLAALARHGERQRNAAEAGAPLQNIDATRARDIVGGAAREGRTRLTETESLDLLGAYGIATAQARLAATVDEAVAIASQLGYPVVLKVSAPAIVHKSDVGGVRTGITSEADLRAGYATLRSDVSRLAPDAVVDGVLVQRSVRGGREMIAGISRDPYFGPLLMFGLGGIFVEALRDVVFRIAPVSAVEARAMVRGIRSSRILDAIRGMPAADREALADVLQRLGQLAADIPAIMELDVNPILAQERGAIALDARVRIESVEASPR